MPLDEVKEKTTEALDFDAYLEQERLKIKYSNNDNTRSKLPKRTQRQKLRHKKIIALAQSRKAVTVVAAFLIYYIR